MKKLINFHITVLGRVQGVGYRAFAVRMAQKLAITGFVRNNVDGSVYIEAEGEAETLSTFLQICKEGPGWAHVDTVRHAEYPVVGYSGFRVKY